MMEGMKHESLEEHVRSHVKYPATKAQILQSCMTDGFAPDEADKAASKLQDKTYGSADEVIKDLQM
jgi:hypothetical protein